MSIPKRIFTIWLGPPAPEWIEKCIATHNVPGYEHVLITSETPIMRIHPYYQECIEGKKWAKAADYLRMKLLAKEGGIYLDADVEVVAGKNFDDLLNDPIFAGEEENGFVSNAIVGAEANHPVLLDYIGKVERNFRGSGDLVFQPGMFLWTEVFRYSEGVKIYPPDYFLPYNHHKNELKITDNTRTIHYFNKSWVGDRVAA